MQAETWPLQTKKVDIQPTSSSVAASVFHYLILGKLHFFICNPSDYFPSAYSSSFSSCGRPLKKQKREKEFLFRINPL